MTTKKESRGICQFCGGEFAKRSMTKHLTGCKKALAAIAAADSETASKNNGIYHLVIQDRYRKAFWLHLEMTGTARLIALDEYLRAIWLECCSHLSEFSYGGWGSEKIDMSTPAKTIFENSAELEHIYDFGTTSETLVKVVGKRTGKPLTKHPIFLMARNEMPIETCMECDNAANWLCLECLYECDKTGYLCDKHVENHPHEAYGDPIERVNSPRIGMCGYDGPAVPPY